MTLSQTALILILSTQAYAASAGILGCNEEVEVAGQGRQAQIQIKDASVLSPVEATVGAEEDNAFAPSVFNTVKRYMGIKAQYIIMSRQTARVLLCGRALRARPTVNWPVSPAFFPRIFLI